MFCTICATLNPLSARRCLACGAGIGVSDAGANFRRRTSHHVARILYVLPLVVLLILASLGVSRYRADQASAAEAYARGEAALAVGEYQTAIEAFAEAGSYRDAEARRADTLAEIAPYRSQYLDGVAALESGHYDAAIAALLPVARVLPSYENAAAVLAEARRRREEELLRQAEEAERQRDWLAADRALATVLADDPDNETVATRLAALRRDHAPILFARDGAIYVVGPDLADERLISDEESASFPTWSPDRTRIAFLSPEPNDYTGRTRLFVVDADGGTLTLLTEDVMLDIWPIWSPDGSHIAVTGYAESRNAGRRREPTVIRVVDVASGQITTATGADMPYVQSPAWSPEGDRLAFISKGDRGRGDGPAYRMEGDVYVLDLASRELTNASNGRLPHAERVTWSPAAEQLLVYSLDRGTPWYERALTSVALFDLTLDAIEEMDNPTRDLGLPYWSPDGRAFAFTEGDQTVRIHWLTDDEDAVVVSRTVASIVTWSPDGGALILVANDPKQASFLVPLDGDTLGATTEISLHFDLANPWLGPPQWSPVDPADLPGPPSVSGTGLDSGGTAT
ncbi:MAG: hypothetical protein ACRDJW_07700 [Thermomicrobiales bacterium]